MNGLSGHWIGATREEDITHEWRIVQRGESVYIYVRPVDTGADASSPIVGYYSGHWIQNALVINGREESAAIFSGPEHFVLMGWFEGRDMLFSRAGLAELDVPAAWTRLGAQLP